MPSTRFGLVALAAFAVNTECVAGDVTLNFSALPSTQGWAFYSQPVVAESSVFGVSGGVLSMNSTSTNAAYYRYDGLVDPALPFELNATARVVSGGTTLAFTVEASGQLASVWLAPTSITVLTGGSFASLGTYDNTAFHEFQLAGVFGGSYTISIDGTAIYSAPLETSGNNTVVFGDGGGLGSGSAELTSLTFRQSLPVPEPSVLAMLMLGLVAVALVGNRRDA